MRATILKIAEKVEATHEITSALPRSLEPLQRLEDIANSLNRIEEKMLDGLMGKHQAPTAVILLVCAVFGLILILDRMGQTDRDLKISKDGISVTK